MVLFQVKELVTPELFARYDRLLLQSSLDTMSDVLYCPRKVSIVQVLFCKRKKSSNKNDYREQSQSQVTCVD